MTLDRIHTIYFIGIGGIGMSALARFFLSRGKKVYGYDKTETHLTRTLVQEGAKVFYEDSIEAVRKEAELVVYTPAVREGVILGWYSAEGYPLMKRSEVLGLITGSGMGICIAGTHGKTSITSMVAHLLRDSGFGCNAFLGGISSNYQTNYWPAERNVFVVEADEFDRSFLRLHPDIAVVSATDPDHLDIYGDAETFGEAFTSFVSLVPKEGKVFLSIREKALGKEVKSSYTTYGLDSNAGLYADNIRLHGRGFLFDVKGEALLNNVYLPVGGMHNVENMMAAIGVAHYLEIPAQKIADAVSNYAGVQRRFEYIIGGEAGDTFTYIDDYAHHPTELKALISSIRHRFEGQKLTIIFQPHLYSRTRDFAQGFAEVLSLADSVLLLPVYPAREKPIEGVSSEMLCDLIGSDKALVISKEEVLHHIHKEMPGVLCTAGAGDIDQLVNQIKDSVENQPA